MSFSSLRRPEAGIDRLKIGRLDRHKTRYRQSLVAPRSMVAGCVLMVAEVLGICHPLGRGWCGLRRSLVRLYGRAATFVDVACRWVRLRSTHSGPDEDDGQRLDLQDEMSISGLVWSGVSVGPASGDDRLRRGVHVNNPCHCRTGRACPICVADSTRHWQLYREVAAAVESEAHGPYEIHMKL